MKKIILFITVSCISAHLIAADNAADNFIAFKNMKAGQKNDWLDYMKKVHDQKFDLLKQIRKDWGSYSNQAIKDWQNNTDCSAAAKNAIFSNQLDKAIKLHEEHIAKFKDLYEKLHEEALKLQEKYKKDLDSFIDRYAPTMKHPAKPGAISTKTTPAYY